MQIAIKDYGINDFDVPSIKAQLLFLPETANFYGFKSRMQLLEMIARYYYEIVSSRSN